MLPKFNSFAQMQLQRSINRRNTNRHLSSTRWSTRDSYASSKNSASPFHLCQIGAEPLNQVYKNSSNDSLLIYHMSSLTLIILVVIETVGDIPKGNNGSDHTFCIQELKKKKPN